MNSIQEVLEKFELENRGQLVEFEKIAEATKNMHMGNYQQINQISDFKELYNDFGMIASFNNKDAANAAQNVLDYDLWEC